MTEQQDKCSICLEAMQGDTLTLSCQHTYHGKCISRWFAESHNECPTCRQPYFDKVERPPFIIPLNFRMIPQVIIGLYNVYVLTRLLLTHGFTTSPQSLFTQYILFDTPYDLKVLATQMPTTRTNEWKLFEVMLLLPRFYFSCVRCKVFCETMSKIVEYKDLFLATTILYAFIF
jgi:hypothetical protein